MAITLSELMQGPSAAKAKKLIGDVISESGKPKDKWEVADWEDLAQFLAEMLIDNSRRAKRYKAVANDIGEKYRRRQMLDKKRVENRKDQKDRRAFQAAVAEKIGDFNTKADAIRAFHNEPRFENYTEATLRSWLKDVWTKPTKPGAPKKKNK